MGLFGHRYLNAVIWFWTILFWINLQSKASDTVVVGLGEQVRLPRLGSVVSIKQGYFKITAVGHQLLFFGLKPGWAPVKVGARHYEINVLSLQQIKTAEILKKIVRPYFGLEVVIEKGAVHLRGPFRQMGLLLELKKHCAREKCEFKNQLEVADLHRSELQTFLNQQLRSVGLYAPVLTFDPEWAFSWPLNQKAKSSLISQSSAFGIQNVFSPQVKTIKPNVRAQFIIAEVHRSSLNQLGIQWPEELSAQNLPTQKWAQTLTAQFIEQSGLGRTLASPTLIARSGGEAELLAGGEIPIKIASERFAQLTWKKYGVLVRLKPQADVTGRMNLLVECEVSSLDGASMVDGIPGIKTNRLKTEIDLTTSKVVVLGGLIKSDQIQAARGLSGLSQLPLIGSLFSSQNFIDQKSELLVFIKPEVVFSHGE